MTRLFISVGTYFSVLFFLLRVKDEKQHMEEKAEMCRQRHHAQSELHSYPAQDQWSCLAHSARSSPPGCTGQTRCPRRAAGCWAGPAGRCRGCTPGR